MRIDRYQRHNLIDWFPTREVKESHFAIIGCGAVGNEVAKNLALLGVGNLSLYDFDEIEIHNLTRSVLFRESDIGQKKVEVAARRVAELDPQISVRSFHGDFWDNLTFQDIRNLNGIICCVDNFEARLKLNRLCRLLSANFINTGIDSRYAVIEVFPNTANDKPACYECNLPDSAYEKIQQRYSCGWLKRVAFVEKKIPTTIVTSSACGAIAASHALRLLTGNGADVSSRVLIDTISGSSSLCELELNLDCPTCSPYQKPLQVMTARNTTTSSFFENIALPVDLSVQVSDPILVSLKCTKCNFNESEPNFILRRASDFDSSISYCDGCGDSSVSVEICDVFDFETLCSLFARRPIPAKFAQVETDIETIVIELEDQK